MNLRMINIKKCGACGKKFQEERFNHHHIQGYQYWCKECQSAYNRGYYRGLHRFDFLQELGRFVDQVLHARRRLNLFADGFEAGVERRIKE